MAEQEYTDEYFINLTMDYDKRDDNIYPKWAVWCAKSEDRYYIDGMNGHFFTHVRTDEEIAIERKKRELMEFLMNQERPTNEEGYPTEEWMEYERYVNEIMFDEKHIMEANPKTFEEWKAEKVSE